MKPARRTARHEDPKMSEAISVAISPNGRLIAAVERTKVSIWNVQTGQIYRQIENAGAGAYSTAAFLDGEGRRLALAQDGSLVLVDVQSGTVIQTLKAHDNPIGAMAASRNGAMIVTGTSSMGGTGEPCKVWGDADTSPASPSEIPQALTLNEVTTINEQRGGVGPLVSAPDGRVVYAGTSNTALTGVPGGMVNSYDTLTGKLLRSFNSEIPRRVSSAASLALSTDGELLAMGTSKGDIVIWETTSGREIASNESYSREISGLLFIEGGRSVLVLISAEQNLPVLDVMTGQETRRLL